jgi:hypothetical protein
MSNPRQAAKDKLKRQLMFNKELTVQQCENLAAAIVDSVMSVVEAERGSFGAAIAKEAGNGQSTTKGKR